MADSKEKKQNAFAAAGKTRPVSKAAPKTKQLKVNSGKKPVVKPGKPAAAGKGEK